VKLVVAVEPWGLSESSRAALALAGRVPGATVIALAASEGSAAEALAEAQRLGAARAVQVIEVALESLEAAALGRTLADALGSLQAEVVLCGARSDGEGRGIVPAAIAHHWSAAYLPHVEELAFAGDQPDQATVVVRAGGRKRRLAVPLPAVLTVGASLSLPAAAPQPVTAVEVIRPADAAERTLGRAPDLGTLERPRRKPVTATSAAELLRRWIDG
jgi:electron transfer flavoprotein alpha/beta subunit